MVIGIYYNGDQGERRVIKVNSMWDSLQANPSNKRKIRRGDGGLFEHQLFLLSGRMQGGNWAWINYIKKNSGDVVFKYSNKVCFICSLCH